MIMIDTSTEVYRNARSHYVQEINPWVFEQTHPEREFHVWLLLQGCEIKKCLEVKQGVFDTDILGTNTQWDKLCFAEARRATEFILRWS
jgi:hypothetical protein